MPSSPIPTDYYLYFHIDSNGSVTNTYLGKYHGKTLEQVVETSKRALIDMSTQRKEY